MNLYNIKDKLNFFYYSLIFDNILIKFDHIYIYIYIYIYMIRIYIIKYEIKIFVLLFVEFFNILINFNHTSEKVRKNINFINSFIFTHGMWHV